MLLFSASTIALIVAAFLQTTEILSFNLVKPNLVLILLVVLSSVYKEWPHRFILLVIGSIILRFSQTFELSDLIPLSAMLLAIVLLDYLPWHRIINVQISVLIGTIILNLVRFVPLTLVLEVSINAILTLIIFALAQIIYAQKITSQEDRF